MKTNLTKEVKSADIKPSSGKNLVEIARKKRYVYLLDKLQNGRPLSSGELKELDKYGCGDLQPGTVRTQEEVAKAMRVSTRSVEHWVKDGMPKTAEGNYDLIEIQAWKAIKNQKKTSQDGSENWDKKYREYKARLAKLELQKAEEKVISRDEVEKGQVERILSVKRALLSLPKAIAPIVGGMEPREIEAYVTEKINEIINQFERQ